MKKLQRRIHRISAVVVGLFALAHLINHVLAVDGIATHIAFMNGIRTVTRHPLGELVLGISVWLQVISGLSGLRNAWRRAGRVARIQALTGAYLAFFLLAHTSAVGLARTIWGLNTNFYFAAGVFTTGFLPVFFIPYYAMAVLALPLHLGCVLYLRLPKTSPRQWAFVVPVVLSILLMSAIVPAFSGRLYPITLPSAVAKFYAWGQLP